MTIKAYQSKNGKESVSIVLSTTESDYIAKLAGFIHEFSGLKLKHSKEGRKFGNGQRGGKWYFAASNGRNFTPEIAKSLGLSIRFKDAETQHALAEVVKDVDYIVNKYLA
jgi:hypothetical protein